MLKRSLPVLLAVAAALLLAPAAGAAPGAIQSGGYASCYLDGGAAYCWSGTSAAWINGQPAGAPDTSEPTLFPGLTGGVTDIALADTHGCAVVGGAAKCWGDNADYQLGDPDYSRSAVPVTVAGLTSGVTDVAAAADYSCAVVGGAVKCWGQAEGLSVGYGADYSPTPFTVPGLSSSATAVAAGYEMACAIVSGAVKCWGVGHLGDGLDTRATTPVTVTGLGDNVTALSINNKTACAIRLGVLKCWGEGAYSFQGDGSASPALTPITPTGMSSGVTAVSVGPMVDCAVVSGALKCWGWGLYGQLGDGAQSTAPTPVTVPGMTSGVTAVSTNFYATCAIVSGVAKCWGVNEHGLLGDATLINALSPVTVPALASGVSDISAGLNAGCAVVSGAGMCWGNLTQPTDDYSPVSFMSASPATVSGLASGVTDIDVDEYGCATVSGAVKCWDSPVLGNPPAATTVFGGESGAVAVEMSGTDGCALISGGVKCGKIVGSYDRALAAVPGLSSGVTQIAHSATHNCAVVSGAAKCWGGNNYGQLGNNDYENTDVPQQVTGLTSGVTAITAGPFFSCAVVSGAAKCWGDGYSAQLGDGDLSESPVPVQVTGLTSGVTAISAGEDHACAVMSGDAYCWGVGDSGEIGDGSRFGSTVPIKAADLPSTVTQVSAGGSHSCAIAGGAGYCWGANTSGQLGVGTTYGIRTPNPTAAPDDAPSVGFVKPIDGSLVNSSTVQVSYAAANTTSLSCSLDGGGWSSCPASYANLADGDHNIRIAGQNAAGRITIDDTTFEIDTVAPDVTITSPANGSVVSTSTPALAFDVDDPDYAYVDCTLDGKSLVGQYDYCEDIEQLPPLSAGKHTLVITAYDYAGNASAATSVFSYGSPASQPAKGPVTVSAKAGASGKPKRSGKWIKFGYAFSFAPPPGTTLSAACHGAVSITARRGRHTLTGRSAALKPVGGNCVANTVLFLPKSSRGKKITFDSSFPGNGVVAPVHDVEKLKIKL